MKARALALAAAVLLAGGALLFLQGCSEKAAVTVGELKTYSDPVYEFGMQYPKEWLESAQAGEKMTIFSSQDTYDWLLTPENAQGKKPGAWIEIGTDTSRNKTLAEFAEIQAAKIKSHQFKVTGQENVKLAGVDAIKINYTYSTLSGFAIVAASDSMMTYVEYNAVGKKFQDYKVIIDTVLATTKLAHRQVKKNPMDEFKPSAVVQTHRDEYIDYSYPDNFTGKNLPKGTNLIVTQIIGPRQDCSVQFDVFDAKNLTVEKVFDQNKGKYKAKSQGSVTIDGQKAMYVAYAPRPDIDSRVYFVVKNNRVTRITMSWYKPMDSDYWPAYEKVLGSLKLK